MVHACGHGRWSLTQMDGGGGSRWHCGHQEEKKKMLVLLMWIGGGQHRWTNSVNAVCVVD